MTDELTARAGEIKAELTTEQEKGTGMAEREEHVHGYLHEKDRFLTRMKRIEGQARGIHRMIEEDKYCIDILTQISALTAAVEGVAMGLLDDHLKHCVVDAAREGGPEAEAKLKEASEAIARLIKS